MPPMARATTGSAMLKMFTVDLLCFFIEGGSVGGTVPKAALVYRRFCSMKLTKRRMSARASDTMG